MILLNNHRLTLMLMNDLIPEKEYILIAIFWMSKLLLLSVEIGSNPDKFLVSVESIEESLNLFV